MVAFSFNTLRPKQNGRYFADDIYILIIIIIIIKMFLNVQLTIG